MIGTWYTAEQAACNGATCSVTPVVTMAGGNYSWQVLAHNSIGDAWSNITNFTILPIVPPTLTAPSGAIGPNHTPAYTWNQVAGATQYYLSVNNSSGNVIGIWYTAAQAGCNGSTCSVTPTTSLPNGNYTWQVLSYNSANSVWSTSTSFSVTVIAAPMLTSPAGFIGPNHTPTYSWNQIAGATQYYLYVNNASGNVIGTWYPTAQAGCNGTICSVTPTTSLANNSYTWQVLASDGTNSAWSAVTSFNVTVIAPPTLVSPTGSIGANYTPTYTWNQVSAATQYYLYVKGPSGDVIGAWYTSTQAACNETTCSVTPTTTLTGGSYTWQVLSYNSTSSAWSAVMTFTTPPAAATLDSPSGSISTHTPPYTWSQVNGATQYYLYVNGPSGNVIGTWYTTTQANCNGVTCSVTPATTLVNGSHTWQVLSYNSVGSVWSTVTTFTTQSQGYAPKKVLAMPAMMDTVNATFVYDGDGNRVAQTLNGVTTYFVGNYYEQTGNTVTKYYYAGASRIAMRTYDTSTPSTSTLNYLLSDHLGSTSLITDSAGALVSETRYTAWGETRYSSGTSPSDYTYTGQYSYTTDFGLMFYNARWYDSSLGRFAQADTVVPGGVQGLDRYAYANNDPVIYADPSGHKPCWATNRYSCNLTNGDISNLKHGSADEQNFIENLLGTPIRHTIYVGGFMVSVGPGKLDQDDGANRITNKVQWLIELFALLKDIGESFQPSVNESNVHTYFSYDEYENGYVDNTTISVLNGSAANVFVRYATFSIQPIQRAHGDYYFDYECATPCGQFQIRPTDSDYLAIARPGETADILMCSNCWGNPIDILPIANGQGVNVRIAFLVPAMTTPRFYLETNLASWR